MFHQKFFLNTVDHVSRQLRLAKQRRIVLMQGSQQWFEQAINSLIENDAIKRQVNNERKSTQQNQYLYFSTQNENTKTLNRKTFQQYLGQECQWLIFDGPMFDINAFAALSGTVVAGGLIFIFSPIKSACLWQSNPFFKRFYQQLSDDSFTLVINEHNNDSIALIFPDEVDEQHVRGFNSEDVCLTQDQRSAVEHIKNVLLGHRRRPLIMTADRGRGKSSALAIACAELLSSAQSSSPITIGITAPTKANLSVFYYQLSQCLAIEEQGQSTICFGNHKIIFFAIDELLSVKQKQTLHLLLIDEAAGIPVKILSSLVEKYARVVLSSTVHGYEGAGRGFTLKFVPMLKQRCSQIKQLHLATPIRWHQNDPVESFVNTSCLLNATPAVENISLSPPKYWYCQPLSSDELMKQERILQHVFSILVTAHYQTKPSDLLLMLNDPQIFVFVVFQHKLTAENIIAVSLVMHEGKKFTNALSDNSIVDEITASHRRFKSQFIPQSLLSHCGERSAFEFNYWRIVRIAVLPQCQNQGIGQFFLTQLAQLAQQQSIDFIGSSFAVNASLYHFWQQAQFSIARLGFSKNKASGEHSCLLLKSLSKKAKPIEQQLNEQFYRSFCFHLLDEFKTMEAELVLSILQNCPLQQLPELTQYDTLAVNDFAEGIRKFSQCGYSLSIWLVRHCRLNTFNEQKSIQTVLPLISRILQKQSIENCCQIYAFNGKKSLNQFLITYINLHRKDLG